jgi:hypothetical protein
VSGGGRVAPLACVACVAILASVGCLGASAAVAPVAAGSDASVAIDDGGDGVVTVAAGERQVIRGTADAPPGTRVTVRVRSTAGDPFVRTAGAVVRADGTWSVAIDVSGRAPGDPVEVTARVVGTDAAATADGEVVTCAGDCRDPPPDPTPTPVATPPLTPDAGPQLAPADETTVESVTVHDADDLGLDAGPRQVVTGTADAPAGTVLVVRVRSVGDAGADLELAQATVRDDGTWVAVFDLSTAAPGDGVRLRAGGPSAPPITAEVGPCPGDCRDPVPGDATPTPTATPPAETGLRAHRGVVRAGDTTKLRFGFRDADAVQVSIGSPERGYRVVAVVADADGDGVATLLFDTGAAGREGATLSVPAGERVTVVDEVDLDAPLPPGTYAVEVRRGATADGRLLDASTVVVEPADTVTAAPAVDRTTPTSTSTPAPPPGGDRMPAFLAVVVGVGFLLGGAGLALVILRR